MAKRIGNMFEAVNEKTILVVSTNSTLNSNGELVMGAGAAGELKKRFPGIQKEFGRLIQLHRKWANSEDYFFLTANFNGRIFGALQTKRHWKEKSDLELVLKSISLFLVWTKGMQHACPDCEIFLNFPGIGLGGLPNKKEAIEKVLKKLPDNVTVWEVGE